MRARYRRNEQLNGLRQLAARAKAQREATTLAAAALMAWCSEGLGDALRRWKVWRFGRIAWRDGAAARCRAYFASSSFRRAARRTSERRAHRRSLAQADGAWREGALRAAARAWAAARKLCARRERAARALLSWRREARARGAFDGWCVVATQRKRAATLLSRVERLFACRRATSSWQRLLLARRRGGVLRAVAGARLAGFAARRGWRRLKAWGAKRDGARAIARTARAQQQLGATGRGWRRLIAWVANEQSLAAARGVEADAAARARVLRRALRHLHSRCRKVATLARVTTQLVRLLKRRRHAFSFEVWYARARMRANMAKAATMRDYRGRLNASRLWRRTARVATALATAEAATRNRQARRRVLACWARLRLLRSGWVARRRAALVRDYKARLKVLRRWLAYGHLMCAAAAASCKHDPARCTSHHITTLLRHRSRLLSLLLHSIPIPCAHTTAGAPPVSSSRSFAPPRRRWRAAAAPPPPPAPSRASARTPRFGACLAPSATASARRRRCGCGGASGGAPTRSPPPPRSSATRCPRCARRASAARAPSSSGSAAGARCWRSSSSPRRRSTNESASCDTARCAARPPATPTQDRTKPADHTTNHTTKTGPADHPTKTGPADHTAKRPLLSMPCHSRVRTRPCAPRFTRSCSARPSRCGVSSARIASRSPPSAARRQRTLPRCAARARGGPSARDSSGGARRRRGGWRSNARCGTRSRRWTSCVGASSGRRTLRRRARATRRTSRSCWRSASQHGQSGVAVLMRP